METEGVQSCSFKTVGEDDASEGLINSESRTPLKTPSKEAEVKFTPNDNLNGDAKINIEHVKSAFAGMTKEELLMYVNDPFWKRVRIILFTLFWLLWVVMFATAIAIIVVAPRCEAPAPRKPLQVGPLYEMNMKDLGNIAALTNKLDHVSEIHAKGVVIDSLADADEHGILDFKKILPALGTEEEFKQFSELAKKKSVQVLMSFVPNYSSINHVWFQKSVKREAPYENYYIWVPKLQFDDDGSPKPPNNWLSQDDGSAWTYVEERGEFYYHQADSNQPDLNFDEPLVQLELEDVLSFWLDLGVSGFNMDKAQYLFEDASRKDEEINSDAPGFTQDQYGFYSHDKTYNTPESASLLSNWREIISKKTNGEGALMITGDAPMPKDTNTTTIVVDFVRQPLLTELESMEQITADELALRINKLTTVGSSWNAIEAGNELPIAETFGESFVDPFNMIIMLLGATPVTYFGDELGFTDSQVKAFAADSSAVGNQAIDERSHLSTYKKLAEERVSQSILYGATNITVLNNSTLTLTRWKAGHPGYILLYNISPENATVNLDEFTQLPTELTAIVLGKGEQILQMDARVRKDSIILSPHSASVFTFVPA